MYSSVGIDQGMDGEAVSLAFASTAGPDCLKDVIMKYGLHLKVYRAIKGQLQCVQFAMIPCHCYRKESHRWITRSFWSHFGHADTVEGMLLALARYIYHAVLLCFLKYCTVHGNLNFSRGKLRCIVAKTCLTLNGISCQGWCLLFYILCNDHQIACVHC